MGITNKEEFNLNELSFETVIGALNKYFANDKYDTSFIEVRKTGVVYLLSSDDLIAWLRIKHGIFYYPGMEAKYAKTEKIPPFSERMMDEGALNSLKKLHKRVTGGEPEVDSHTLIADGIAHQVSVYEAEVEELKEKYNFLQDEFGKGKIVQEFLDRRKKMNAKLDTVKKGLEDILKVIDDTT